MLGNETLWSVAERCNAALTDAEIPYSVCGGVAVCLHGYQRNTVDLDVVVRSDDSAAIRATLEANGFEWDQQRVEFRSTDGIAVQCLLAGQRAGKGSSVMIPDPTGQANVEQLQGLSVVRLSRLIEMKLACGIGNLRRTHKDFADVVELIDVRNLDGAFAGLLHKSVRDTFRELVRNVRSAD